MWGKGEGGGEGKSGGVEGGEVAMKWYTKSFLIKS